MAQILEILGGLLIMGGGVYLAVSGKPVTMKDGRQLSRTATLGIAIGVIALGALVTIAAFAGWLR